MKASAGEFNAELMSAKPNPAPSTSRLEPLFSLRVFKCDLVLVTPRMGKEYTKERGIKMSVKFTSCMLMLLYCSLNLAKSEKDNYKYIVYLFETNINFIFDDEFANIIAFLLLRPIRNRNANLKKMRQFRTFPYFNRDGSS